MSGNLLSFTCVARIHYLPCVYNAERTKEPEMKIPEMPCRKYIYFRLVSPRHGSERSAGEGAAGQSGFVYILYTRAHTIITRCLFYYRVINHETRNFQSMQMFTRSFIFAR